VRRCKNNEPEAQRILYSMYVEDMMILCLRYIANKEDAKEAMMDGFLSFFRNLDKFSYLGAGSVKAWLKKIVINQCLMQLRKRKTLITSDLDTDKIELQEDGASALDMIAAKEILELLQSLPDGYRTVFNLYVFDGLNHKEIATLLQISEQTSKSQLHRARMMMQEKITLSK
jgi:RNA polymerase sigma-70 factor, ECF subfamily